MHPANVYQESFGRPKKAFEMARPWLQGMPCEAMLIIAHRNTSETSPDENALNVTHPSSYEGIAV
jgi:hypothetical protein